MAKFVAHHSELMRSLTQEFFGQPVDLPELCGQSNLRLDEFCEALRDLEYVGYIYRLSPTRIRVSNEGIKAFKPYELKSRSSIG